MIWQLSAQLIRSNQICSGSSRNSLKSARAHQGREQLKSRPVKATPQGFSMGIRFLCAQCGTIFPKVSKSFVWRFWSLGHRTFLDILGLQLIRASPFHSVTHLVSTRILCISHRCPALLWSSMHFLGLGLLWPPGPVLSPASAVHRCWNHPCPGHSGASCRCQLGHVGHLDRLRGRTPHAPDHFKTFS